MLHRVIRLFFKRVTRSYRQRAGGGGGSSCSLLLLGALHVGGGVEILEEVCPAANGRC